MEHSAGRGVVELTIEKPDGSDAYVVNEGGGPRPQAHLTLVLEGYSAPVTAGNFAVNVMNKQYLGKSLIVDYTGILVGKGEVSGTYGLYAVVLWQDGVKHVHGTMYYYWHLACEAP